MKKISLILLLAATAACSKGMADGELTPGNWKQTATIKDITVPGAPPQVVAALKGMVGQTKTEENCMSAAEAKAGVKAMAQGMQKGAGQCTSDGFTSGGGKMAGKITCKTGAGGDAVMTINGTYDPKKLDMTADMETANPAMPGGKAIIHMQMVAEHVGECKK